MGKLVNVVLQDGSVHAVSEEDAARLSAGRYGHAESTGEQAERARADVQAEEHSGIGSKVGAFVEGAADMATGGLAGKAEGYFGGEDVAQNMQARAQENPGSRMLGEGAALVAPTGWLGDAAKGASEFTAVGQTARAGAAITEATGSKVLGRLAEGGMFGVQGYVAHSNVTGDPLTIEGTLESAGIGGVLSVGLGAMADGFGSLASKAKAALTEGSAVKADMQLVEQGKKILNDPPPSWNEFVDSHGAATKAARAYNREVAKEAEDYTNFYGGTKLGKAARETQDLVNYLQNERYAAQTETGNVQWIEGKPRGVQYVYEEGGTNERRILSPSKPPMSPEYAAQMKDLQRRMTRVHQLMADNVDIVASEKAGRWVKRPGIPSDPKRALEELRAIQTDLKAEYPAAFSGALKDKGFAGIKIDLPDAPRDLVPVTDVKLPKTPREFARMTPEKVAELANGLDPASASAFQRFTSDVGLEVKGTVGETVASVHKSIGEYTSAYDRLVSAAAKQAADEADKPLLLKILNKGAKYAGARAFDVGGVTGGITRVLGGEAVGRAMTGIEDSVLGGALMAGKDGIKEKVRRLVAKWGVPAANAAEGLRPVTSYLASSFTGEKDSEKDVRVLAARRAAEIQQLAMTAPDISFSAFQGLMGASNDIAYKMHAAVVGAIQHLAQIAPRDNGLDTTMFGSNWTPAYHEAITFAHQLEAVQQPMAAVARILGGQGHPAAAVTMWQVWPAIMQELANEVATNAPRLQKLSHNQTRPYSTLMQQPLSGSQHPVVVTTLQGLYLPKPSAPAGGGGSGRPSGRPAAVQSPVAGSNVSSLVSQ